MAVFNMTKVPAGTPFQQKVWRALLSIPKGQTRTYTQIARQIGHPKAYRAVANACAANPMLITVPCHRAVGSNGNLGGYSGKGGVKTKKALLKKEGAL